MSFQGRKSMVMAILLLILLLSLDIGMKCSKWENEYKYPVILNTLILGFSISIMLNLLLSFGISFASTHIGIYKLLSLLIGLICIVSLYLHGKLISISFEHINNDHICLLALPLGIVYSLVTLFTLKEHATVHDEDIINDEESCVGSITSKEGPKVISQSLETIHEEDVHKCDVSPCSTMHAQFTVSSCPSITGQADVIAGHPSPGLPVRQSLSMGGQLLGSRITGGTGNILT